MFTSSECRAHAEEKLAQAERDYRHRKRLIRAAEGWFLLASQLRRIEASVTGVVTTSKESREVGRLGRKRSI